VWGRGRGRWKPEESVQGALDVSEFSAVGFLSEHFEDISPHCRDGCDRVLLFDVARECRESG